MLKLLKVGFEKMVAWQRLNCYWSNQHTIVFPEKSYEKPPNFVTKIRIYLSPPPPPCKIGLRGFLLHMCQRQRLNSVCEYHYRNITIKF